MSEQSRKRILFPDTSLPVWLGRLRKDGSIHVAPLPLSLRYGRGAPTQPVHLTVRSIERLVDGTESNAAQKLLVGNPQLDVKALAKKPSSDGCVDSHVLDVRIAPAKPLVRVKEALRLRSVDLYEVFLYNQTVAITLGVGNTPDPRQDVVVFVRPRLLAG
jgi:hypothetical protein